MIISTCESLPLDVPCLKVPTKNGSGYLCFLVYIDVVYYNKVYIFIFFYL